MTHSDLIALAGAVQDALPNSASKKFRTSLTELVDAIMVLDIPEPTTAPMSLDINISEADTPSTTVALEGGTLNAVRQYLAWDARAGLDFEAQEHQRELDRAERASMTREDIEALGYSRQQAALEAHLADARASSCPCYAHQQVREQATAAA